MRHGIFLPPFGSFGDPRVLVELAVDAERAGFDGFFLWDHLMHRVDGPYADAWLALAAIAGRTERIRLGPLVTPLPRRRPWKVAREAVTLDHLTAGRAVLGVGIGTDAYGEFSAFEEAATDDRRRAQLLDGALEVITRLWTGESVDATGEHFPVHGARFVPPPVQRPRIPIWCAAVWPHRAPLRRAARYDGVVPMGRLSPSDVGELRAFVAAHRSPDSPFHVVIASIAADGTPPAVYDAAGATWWLESFVPHTPIAEAQAIVRRGPAR